MRVRQYKGYGATNHSSTRAFHYSDSRSVYRKNEIDIDEFQLSSKVEGVLKGNVCRHFLHYHSMFHQLPSTAVNVHHLLDSNIAHIKNRLGQGKMVLSVHDIIPLLAAAGRFGSYRNSIVDNLNVEAFFMKQQLKNIRDFNKVIVPSVSTANDLQDLLSLERQKIEIVPPALSNEFKKLPRTIIRQFRAKHGLDPKSYWILVSGDNLKQNQKTSLQVLKELNKKSSKSVKLLAFDVPNNDLDSLAKECGVSELVKQVKVHGNAEKAIVYNLAHCFLYPSIYSGFGMPVVESVACGTPVVTSDRGALKELFPKHAMHVNPFDILSLSKEVYRCIAKREVRDLVATESKTLVQEFRPEIVTNQIVGVYRSLIS